MILNHQSCSRLDLINGRSFHLKMSEASNQSNTDSRQSGIRQLMVGELE